MIKILKIPWFCFKKFHVSYEVHLITQDMALFVKVPLLGLFVASTSLVFLLKSDSREFGTDFRNKFWRK